MLVVGSSDGSYFNGISGSAGVGPIWQWLIGTTAWSLCSAHAVGVRADSAVLVLGGRWRNSCLNNVWSSADGGAPRAQLIGPTAWNASVAFAVVVHVDGTVLLLGGTGGTQFNDVYSSEACGLRGARRASTRTAGTTVWTSRAASRQKGPTKRSSWLQRPPSAW